MFSDYIVFVDESGDHNLERINAEWPLFVLSFCVFPVDAYVHQVIPAIRALKCKIFGHDLVVFHEREIRKKQNAFSHLSEEVRNQFLYELTEIIQESDVTIVAVVIDKTRHRTKYRTPEHPYHLAMQFGLERIADYLSLQDQTTKRTPVIFESRGKEEDKELELEFLRVCAGGNRNYQPYLFDLHLAEKKCNSDGLQLADLTARPIGLSVLRPQQPNRAWNVIERKLYRGRKGFLYGNGLKIFP